MSVLEAAQQKQQGTTDKYLHYYDAYEFHFSSLKNAEITLLEIGVRNGWGLCTWRRNFANGRVFGGKGIYVIEDLHTSYWPKFGGRPGGKDTCMEFLKTLIDKLHGWALRSSWAEPFQVSSVTDDLE